MIRRFVTRLARENAGNVIMILAASLFPLLALVGSGIDMGRGYLAQTRLQQACDAGTLAARKRLGTAVAVNGEVPDVVADTGQRFFNINFRDGSYGSQDRDFSMTLEEDYAISGMATAQVPTTIMGAFGFDFLPISASCSAQINMANTDVMMVLDTTGSMLQTNAGDSQSRIDALRDTVKSFYAQMEASKSPGTRIRYGFVPYSTNVNVGRLLQDDWLVDEWEYNYRVAQTLPLYTTRPVYEDRWYLISGSMTTGSTTIQSSCPSGTYNYTQTNHGTSGEWEWWEYLENGVYNACTEDVDSGTYQVQPRTYNNRVIRHYRRQTGTEQVAVGTWKYDTMDMDLSFLEDGNSVQVPMGGDPGAPTMVTAWYRGCIEERSTYQINNYNNVNLNRAIDLDIDRVPDPNDPDTQWRPMLNELSYLREVRLNGLGLFTSAPILSSDDFVNAQWWGFSACPTASRRLAEMSASEVATYVDNLSVQGSTYHDIGMIWGGRLLSPTGIFAADNADVDGRPTQRHMIYLTDGETAPLDVSYGAYGIEPIDRRRWAASSSMSLTETVEARFSFACEEVKKRNIQVWVISFGTAANPIMEQCAGAGRYYVAENSDELEDTFSDIARRMGELRIVD